VQGEAVHEGEFLHLLERIAVVEVPGHQVVRSGDLAVMEILASGGFGEELEDVIEPGVLDDNPSSDFCISCFCSSSGPKGAIILRTLGMKRADGQCRGDEGGNS
jgi:hypothetical protein